MEETIEVKKVGDQYHIFVNDEKSVCGCELCIHFIDEGDCKMSKDEDGNYRNDEKMYPFCGKVCGHFKHF